MVYSFTQSQFVLFLNGADDISGLYVKKNQVNYLIILKEHFKIYFIIKLMNFLIKRCDVCHTHIEPEYTYVPQRYPCVCGPRVITGVINLPSYDTLERRIEELEKIVNEKDRIIETLTRKVHPLGVFRF